MTRKIQSLGIMNGTSLDAIDYALIETDKKLEKLRFKKHIQKKIPKALKQKLFRAATNNLSSYELSELHFGLGKLYAQHIQDLGAFDLVGLHGQTIYHRGGHVSFQIGHPGFCSKICGKPVYYDFRSADIIQGGQGAPFAPFFQKHLSQQLGSNSMAFHNLGGISNLTLIKESQVRAWDTGPGNILIDTWIKEKTGKQYDKNGNFASKALPCPITVNDFLKHSFFKKNPPKSTGREQFNLSFIKKQGAKNFKKLDLCGQLSSLTELTALSIHKAYQKEKIIPKTIYFYGGGVLNSYLMDRIQFWLPDTKIKTTDELGWPAQAFEACVFGFLALARHFEKKVHLPKVTGAKKKVLLGSQYL